MASLASEANVLCDAATWRSARFFAGLHGSSASVMGCFDLFPVTKQ
jgi:hypothetical protein